MGNNRPIETAIIVGLLFAGGVLFWMAVTLSGTIPEEYRSASPGFGWSWDFNAQDAIGNAGRLGELPLPWKATEIGNRLLLPLDQPLDSKRLRLTYRGETEPGGFRLDVVIKHLDSKAVYSRKFKVAKAKRGFRLADQSFVLEEITPLYVRLRSAD
jgi:hypothetical protein